MSETGLKAKAFIAKGYEHYGTLIRLADASAAVEAARVEHLTTTWPPRDAVEKLIQAADHLYEAHNCDTDGHEEFRAARNAAWNWLTDSRYADYPASSPDEENRCDLCESGSVPARFGPNRWVHSVGLTGEIKPCGSSVNRERHWQQYGQPVTAAAPAPSPDVVQLVARARTHLKEHDCGYERGESEHLIVALADALEGHGQILRSVDTARIQAETEAQDAYRENERLKESYKPWWKRTELPVMDAVVINAENRYVTMTQGAADAVVARVNELEQQLATVTAERDALQVEYESRAIWIAKMNAILGYDNSDGFHSSPSPHETAAALREKVGELESNLAGWQSCFAGIDDPHFWASGYNSRASRIAELEGQLAAVTTERDVITAAYKDQGEDLGGAELPEEIEWKQLAAIPKNDRSEQQSSRLRELANWIRDNLDAKRLRERVGELEQRLKELDHTYADDVHCEHCGSSKIMLLAGRCWHCWYALEHQLAALRSRLGEAREALGQIKNKAVFVERAMDRSVLQFISWVAIKAAAALSHLDAEGGGESDGDTNREGR